MNQYFKRLLDLLIHIGIISSAFYAAFQLFGVFKNSEGPIILFKSATNISMEHLVARRLYALEFWIITTCYIVYLGMRQRIWNFDDNK